MSKLWSIAFGVTAGALIAGTVFAASGAPQSVGTRSQSAVVKAAASPYSVPGNYRAMVDKYCVTCHSEDNSIPAGNPLFLDDANYDDVAKDAGTWEMVIHKLGIGEMPPLGKAHPNPVELQGFRDWLATALDKAADQENDPGNFLIHRLNRAEYANAIRDLFGVQINVADILPTDSADFGFDNIASALQSSASLIGDYLSAAELVSTAAVGDPKTQAGEVIFPISLGIDQRGHIRGLPIGTRGGTLIRYNFPADGMYELSGQLMRPVDTADRGMEGQDVPNQFQILVDGVPVHTTLIGGQSDFAAAALHLAQARQAVADRMKVRTFIKAGPHAIAFTFVDRPDQSQDIYETSARSSEDIHDGAGRPTLQSATVSGPFDARGVSPNPYRKRLFVCEPGASAGAQTACARRILSTLARRAYRRPVTPGDMKFIMSFYDRGRQNGGSFDAGIREALPVILTSPSFLYRIESDPTSVPAGVAHRITDLELASRLSFFLWSSIPDDQLLDLAIAGRLHQPKVLEQQVRRMLADDRAKAFTTNFPDQWLELRNLATVAPDLLSFPDWDDSLRNDLKQETDLFFDYIARHNQSAMDLLNANYTFLDARLARHYGIPGIYGTAFRRVTLTPAEHRGGLLTQGSILALTAVGPPPIFRGKWVLTALMNDPPLAPPPNVPALPSEASAKTMRERLDLHTKVEPCAGCHGLFDPIGFALQGYNETGQWRTSENGQPIDSSGVLLDGTRISGPQALDDWLTQKRPDVFVGTLTQNLLIYALGRGLQPYDMPVVRGIVRRAARDDYRFQDLIIGIVESRPFQERKKIVEPVKGPLQQTAQVQE